MIPQSVKQTLAKKYCCGCADRTANFIYCDCGRIYCEKCEEKYRIRVICDEPDNRIVTCRICRGEEE